MSYIDLIRAYTLPISQERKNKVAACEEAFKKLPQSQKMDLTTSSSFAHPEIPRHYFDKLNENGRCYITTIDGTDTPAYRTHVTDDGNFVQTERCISVGASSLGKHLFLKRMLSDWSRISQIFTNAGVTPDLVTNAQNHFVLYTNSFFQTLTHVLVPTDSGSRVIAVPLATFLDKNMYSIVLRASSLRKIASEVSSRWRNSLYDPTRENNYYNRETNAINASYILSVEDLSVKFLTNLLFVITEDFNVQLPVVLEQLESEYPQLTSRQPYSNFKVSSETSLFKGIVVIEDSYTLGRPSASAPSQSNTLFSPTNYTRNLEITGNVHTLHSGEFNSIPRSLSNNRYNGVNGLSAITCNDFRDVLVGDNFPLNFIFSVHNDLGVNRNTSIAGSSALLNLDIGENLTTDNDNGHLMNYSARVPAYKKSFRLTEDEVSYFSTIITSKQPELTAISEELAGINNEVSRIIAAEKLTPDKLAELLSLNARGEKLENDLKSGAGITEKPIFLGLELEAQARGEYRNSSGLNRLIKSIATSSFGEHCLLKSDSSTGDYGFELVTIPASLQYHKKMFKESFFANNFQNMMQASDRCGIHVHISKDAFTPITLGKFIYFINNPSNRKFIDEMAGRTPNGFCVRNNTSKLTSEIRRVGGVTSIKNIKKTNIVVPSSAERRAAVNLTNQRTIEVRIFKSSKSENNILRKLEFCEALTLFVRTHGHNQMTVYDFVNFCLQKDNKTRYRSLLIWLASRDYIDHERKRVKGTDKLIHVYSTNKVPLPDTDFHKKNFNSKK